MEPVLPKSRLWREIFRYIIQTMDADDPSMDFIVSLWGHSLRNNGELTDRQASKVRPYCFEYLLARGIDINTIPDGGDSESA